MKKTAISGIITQCKYCCHAEIQNSFSKKEIAPFPLFSLGDNTDFFFSSLFFSHKNLIKNLSQRFKRFFLFCLVSVSLKLGLILYRFMFGPISTIIHFLQLFFSSTFYFFEDVEFREGDGVHRRCAE